MTYRLGTQLTALQCSLYDCRSLADKFWVRWRQISPVGTNVAKIFPTNNRQSFSNSFIWKHWHTSNSFIWKHWHTDR